MINVDWGTVLTSTVFSAVVSGGAAIWQTRSRHKHELRQRHFELLYQEYKTYLEKMEDMNSAAQKFLTGEFLPRVQEIMDRIIAKGGDDSDDSDEMADARELNALLSKMMAEVIHAFADAKSQMQGLRIVCSRELLILVDQFVSEQDHAMQIMQPFFEVVKQGEDATLHVKALHEQGMKAKNTLNQIIDRMREELDLFIIRPKR